jgi:uncharacterized membrane protein
MLPAAAPTFGTIATTADRPEGDAMDGLIAARVLHVLGVVLWIGGVAMVTTVLLPAAQRMKSPGERADFFDSIERRFAAQARVTTLVTGASGLYLVHALDLWQRFARLEYWWMHAMVAVWALFTLMLFVIEPLARRRLSTKLTNHQSHGGDRSTGAPDAGARRAAERRFARIVRLHWILLALSLATIAGAVAGSHGYLLQIGR